MHVGGTEMNAVRTAERLDPDRWEVEVVCLQKDGPLRVRYAAAGIPIHTFPIDSLYGASMWRQGRRLAAWLRERRVHVLHAHDMYSNAFAVPWARRAGTPAVIASRRWARELMPFRHRVANDLTTRLAHGMLVNSSTGAERLRSRERFPADRVVTIPNFVDAGAFEPIAPAVRARLLAELGIPAGARVVGIVANLTPVKDHATLLRAVADIAPRIADLHLVLVGKGECQAQLEGLSRDLKISDRVHFAGGRSNDPNLHHLFEVSVLCSLSEGLSNSVLEAMAAGNPVVATHVGAIGDAVLDGETGILVPPKDAVSLGGAIERLLTTERVGAQMMGEAGRRRAEALYSPTAALTALENFYEALLARATKGGT